MTDNITLPRKVVREALEALEFAEWNHDGKEYLYAQEITALRTALAAEPTKPEPVATVGTQSNAAWKGYDGRWSPPGDPIKVVHLLRDLPLGTLLYAAPPEDEALRRDAEQGRWLREWLDNNGLLIRAIRGESLAGYEHPDIEALRRDAELGRWIREETPPIEEIAARVDAMEDER